MRHAVVALALLCACGDDAAPADDSPQPTVETDPPDTHPEKAPPRPEAPEVAIAPAEGGGSVVTYPGAAGGRVTVREGSRAFVSGLAPFAIVLARGEAHAVVPPAGNVERPELRIGTPAGSVIVGGSSELVVRVAPDGRVWVAVLTGLAHVESGQLVEGGVARTELSAGNAARMAAAGPGTVSNGPTRLDEVAAAADRALSTGAEATIDPADVERALADLREALTAADAQAAEGRRLAEAQRGAEPEGARALQRQIVEHSQRMRELRRALTVRWERARAAGAARSDELPPDLAAQRSAVAQALGVDAPAEDRGIP